MPLRRLSTDRAMSDLLKALGIVATLLMVLFTCRAIYHHFIEEARRTAEVESRLQVAREQVARPASGLIDRLAALDVASLALEQALEYQPDDPHLEREAFFVFAEIANTDLEYRPYAYDDWKDYLPELTSSGWQVLEHPLTNEEQTRTMVALARLEFWLFASDSLATADRLLRKALSIDPQHPEARFFLAKNLLRQDADSQEALELLQALVADYPRQPRYLVELARLDLEHDREEIALDLLQDALMQKNAQSDWRNNLGQVRARSLIYERMQHHLRAGNPLPAEVDEELAATLMSGHFSMSWADRALASLFWWRRGDYPLAVRYLVQSDTTHDRQSPSRLLTLELRLLEVPEEILYPSLAEIRASLERGPAYDFLAGVLPDITAYVSGVEEYLLLELPLPGGGAHFIGLEVQHWPDTEHPLLVRRVVPGSMLAEAGVRPGDRLRQINRVPAQTVTQLQNALLEQAAGRPLELAISRAGSPVRIELAGH